MEALDAQSMELLGQAKARAERLLSELIKHQSELEKSPPNLPPEKQAAGQLAVNNAVDSARRALESLDSALRIAATSSN